MSGSGFWSLVIVLVPAAAAAFWWTSARARELAVRHAREACRRQQVQFLDQTVALDRIQISRSRNGTACLRRTFAFEFTDHADYRDRAEVTMNGARLLRVNFPWRRDEDGNRVLEH